MKGQSFEVFKMLIGAIFSISILLIGMMYITNINLPVNTYYLLKKGLESAYNAPGKEIENTIFYKKGQIFEPSQFKIKNLEFESHTSKINCENNRCVVVSDISVLTKFWCSPSRTRCIITFEKIKV